MSRKILLLLNFVPYGSFIAGCLQAANNLCNGIKQKVCVCVRGDNNFLKSSLTFFRL